MVFSFIYNKLSSAFWACAAIALCAVGALAFAYYMQYERGLDPCHLCLLQRWPYRIAAVLGVAGFGLAHMGRTNLAGWIVLLCSVLFFGESGLAFYHVGVEQHWWRSIFEGCTISFPKGGDLLSQIEAKPAARCDEIAWTLIGLSMAGWNMLLAFGLGLACLVSGAAVLRRTEA